MKKDNPSDPPASENELELQKLRLEFERLKFERTKLAIELRLKRREARPRGAQSLRDALSNPLALAIVGGSLTLLTSIVTNYVTASANRDADDQRALHARDTDSRALQSELLKTFLHTQDSKTARDNLTFLIEAGLIPDHEKRISDYLKNNTKTIPKIAEAPAPAAVLAPCKPLDLGKNQNPRADGEPLGVSLHLGTNRVNPNAYGGWDGTLQSAVLDAQSMEKLAADLGYHTNRLVDDLDRSDCLLAALDKISKALQAGDTLLLTMSGHGSQEKDETAIEPDGLMESWVLYDKPLKASELRERFASYASGVTIIVVEDSSHASAFRPVVKGGDLSANLIVLAGARENQVGADGTRQGLFTEALLGVWDKGKFTGSYENFVDAIRKKIPQGQTPQLYVYGPDESTASRRPFYLGAQK